MSLLSGSVLIDTWWNVNKKTSRFITNDASVLIDTWWNVNYILIACKTVSHAVLIDTWWNVNFSDIKSNNESVGFNRYMVECE